MIDPQASIQIIHNDLCCEMSPIIGCSACGGKRCNYHYEQLRQSLYDTHRKLPWSDTHKVALCTTTNTIVCSVTPGLFSFVEKCTHKHERGFNEPAVDLPKVGNAGRP